MPSLSVKKDIQACYANVKTQLAHFAPRKAQSFLIAELAKTISGHYQPKRRILVAEAGTGIGKSFAYLLGSIPCALHDQKKVVISTATIALQEQLFHKDLPLFAKSYPKPFVFILAKGRQRYCCAQKLANALHDAAHEQTMLFEWQPSPYQQALLKELHDALQSGRWDGDRDSWPDALSEQLWQAIVSDRHTCHSGLAQHRSCPFSKAREQLTKADVIITNHNLLMADLDLGGGAILSAPDQTYYMIDEAHHLPHTARELCAASASLLSNTTMLHKLAQATPRFALLAKIADSNPKLLDDLSAANQQSIALLSDTMAQLQNLPLDGDGQHRFCHGELPEQLAILAKNLNSSCRQTSDLVAKMHGQLTEQLTNNHTSQAQTALSESAYFVARTQNLAKVWQLVAAPLAKGSPPPVRWISKAKQENEYNIHVSTFDVSEQLETQLWSKAAAIGLFSATLRSMNSFNFFCAQTGLSQDDGTQFIALPAPFDHKKNGNLIIPQNDYLPDQPQFTRHLPKILRKFLQDQKATLVLFCSYWQMNETAQALAEYCQKNGWALHVQGEKSRNELIKAHIACCKAGQVSILFGTNSFAEGLDLQGELLTNLIITKLPFAPPSSPIEQAHAEYIIRHGGNPFAQLTIPQACKQLVQATGRLLRSEQDCGRIILLDRRIVTKSYGKALLAALPPFSVTID